MNQKLTKDEIDRLKGSFCFSDYCDESCRGIHPDEARNKLLSHIAALEEEIETFKNCLCSLESVVTKAIPYIDGLCVFGHIHGQKYLGPSWEKELKSARKLLNIKIEDL